MQGLARAYVATSVVGAVCSIRCQRCARFAGVRVPGSATQHAWTIGTPLSAPPLMLGGLLVAARAGRSELVRLLACGFVIGIAGEPDSWSTLRRPGANPMATACVVLDVVLPLALVVRGSSRQAEAA